ncbi:hypothetical protein BC938DRAFT_472484 [Jimgerdemannia flammicorona]|uniref:AB hydrolase-1 domain-containing protein n=1 Tax=Jimgerdemannia flammicorona TaxID=994334 RepID=A0A433Q611_9FUNG|nr:hypothetical protein BC938DRAFT_472484 [Jimgerdemannia flammicorona]
MLTYNNPNGCSPRRFNMWASIRRTIPSIGTDDCIPWARGDDGINLWRRVLGPATFYFFVHARPITLKEDAPRRPPHFHKTRLFSTHNSPTPHSLPRHTMTTSWLRFFRPHLFDSLVALNDSDGDGQTPPQVPDGGELDKPSKDPTLGNYSFLFHKSWSYYLILLCLIIPVWSITPLSCLYTLYTLISLSLSGPFIPALLALSPIRLLAFSYTLLESLFFLLHLRVRLHHQRHVSPPAFTRAEMTELFRRCVEGVTDFEERFPLWFFGVEFQRIRRENVLDWLAWAFLCRPLKDINMSEEDGKFLNHLLNELEVVSGHKFPEGRDDDVKCARLTLDPVEGIQRPLVAYLVISFMDQMCAVTLYFLGFRRYSYDNVAYWLYMPDEAVQAETGLQKNYDGVDRSPVVFVHGIGMGLMAYIPFLNFLHKHPAYPRTRPLLLLELPHISMSLPFVTKLSHPPTMHETVAAISSAFTRHGLVAPATWCGHSLGTIVAGWTRKHRPDLVRNMVLIDPVCFMLWEADLCHNFVYKMPCSGWDLVQWYFVAKEAGITWILGRHFWWYQNILFPSQLLSLPSDSTNTQAPNVHIFLGGRDKIINASRVAQYLHKNGVPTTLFRKFSHADAILIGGEAWDKIVAEVVKQ